MIQKCATCGVDIGGLSHNLLESNKDVDSKLEGNKNYSQKSGSQDQSDRGYCFRPAAEESEPFSHLHRDMKPVPCRVLRFLLHSSLLMGAVASSLGLSKQQSSKIVKIFGNSSNRSGEWQPRVLPLLNTAYFPADADPAAYFAEHLRSDWDILKSLLRRSSDDISLLLHFSLRGFSMDAPQNLSSGISATLRDVKKFFGSLLPGAKRGSPVEGRGPSIQGGAGEHSDNLEDASQEAVRAWSVFSSLDQRAQWEKMISSLFFEKVFCGDNSAVTDQLKSALKDFGTSNDEQSVFQAELMETFDVRKMDALERARSCPALWSYRRPFSLSDFTLELSLNPEASASHPLLSSFLTEEPQLRALRYIPKVFLWQAMLLKRFNRCLDRDMAQKITVREVIEKEGNGAGYWRSAFEGFRNAWSLAWPYVNRFGCMIIPPVYKQMEMTLDSPISFSLPCEKDEGICCVALTRYLCERHNAFVERLDELHLLRGDVAQRALSPSLNEKSDVQRVIQSRFMVQSHSISYDLAGGFIPFVEKQCQHYSIGGGLLYDFKGAEDFLLDIYFSGIALILILLLFTWCVPSASSFVLQTQGNL